MGIIRVKDPFLCVVKLVIGLVGNVSKRLLHLCIPVGLDQVLEIATVGRTRMRDVCTAC